MSNVPVLELVSERPGRPLVLLHGWGAMRDIGTV